MGLKSKYRLPDVYEHAFKVTKPLHSLHHGKLYDLHYFCDICSIDQAEPGPCMCCREEVRLIEEPEPEKHGQ